MKKSEAPEVDHEDDEDEKNDGGKIGEKIPKPKTHMEEGDTIAIQGLCFFESD